MADDVTLNKLLALSPATLVSDGSTKTTRIIRLRLYGESGSGKSTTINGVWRVVENETNQKVFTQKTTSLDHVAVAHGTNDPLWVELKSMALGLCDTPGMALRSDTEIAKVCSARNTETGNRTLLRERFHQSIFVLPHDTIAWVGGDAAKKKRVRTAYHSGKAKAGPLTDMWPRVLVTHTPAAVIANPDADKQVVAKLLQTDVAFVYFIDNYRPSKLQPDAATTQCIIDILYDTVHSIPSSEFIESGGCIVL